MPDFYVLLDAMGIQRYVFDTNRLQIIVGGSHALAEWHLQCRAMFPDHVIVSAGGNVLARFGSFLAASWFRCRALEIGPPGMEIAWATVQAPHGSRKDLNPSQAYAVWEELQKGIAAYKAGDRSPSDYPWLSPALAAGCPLCGKRPLPEGTRRSPSCGVCLEKLNRFKKMIQSSRATHLEAPRLSGRAARKLRTLASDGVIPADLFQSATWRLHAMLARAGILRISKTHPTSRKGPLHQRIRWSRLHPTSTQKLYDVARDRRIKGAFPIDLKTIVKKPENGDRPGEGDPELLAVVVIDLNGMGNRIQDIVRKGGFDDFAKFSKSLERDLDEMFRKLLVRRHQERTGRGSSRWIARDRKGQTCFRLRPLLLAGDDMVFAMPASLWPQYVNDLLGELQKLGHPACAGVAVARHTYPINQLIQMAEEMVSSAKALVRHKASSGSGTEQFAVDWHMHQESSSLSAMAVRRRAHVRSISMNTEYAVSTRKPYLLSEFLDLLEEAKDLGNGGDSRENSNRSLFALYQALRLGPRETRDTLVRRFLRGEGKELNTYGYLWRWVHETDGDHPLWERIIVRESTGHKTCHFTRYADLLELYFSMGVADSVGAEIQYSSDRSVEPSRQ